MSQPNRSEVSAATQPVAPAPITDRANGEPAILRGLTASEVALAALVAFPFWAVVGALVALATRIWAIAVLVAALAPMLSVWMFAGYLATLKRGRPDGYYMHRFKHWLADIGFAKNPFITHTGPWDLGRPLEGARGGRRTNRRRWFKRAPRR